MEKSYKDKSFVEQQLSEARFRLQEFETKGLDMFNDETSRKLIIEMCINKLKEDIKFYQELLKQNNNHP